MLNLSSRHVHYTSMIYLEMRLEVSFSWRSKLLSSISTFYSYLKVVYRGDAIVWLPATLHLVFFWKYTCSFRLKGAMLVYLFMAFMDKMPLIKDISGFSINAIEAIEMVYTELTQRVSFLNFWSFIYFNITALIPQIMRYSSAGMEVIHLTARVGR